MKYFWKPILMAMAAVLLMAMVSCSSSEDIPVPDDDTVVDMMPIIMDAGMTEDQKQMRDNNNEFACRLFRTVLDFKEDKGSTVLSPISVTYLLGMLNEGAYGETLKQISDVLGMGDSPQLISEYCQKMISEASAVDPSVTIKIANAIDVNSAMGINLYPEYASAMRSYYNAQIEALDFNKRSSLDHINNWCSTHTDGMIPFILDEISPSCVMYLLNAIYFKAIWTQKFDPKATRNMDFSTPDGKSVKRKLMHRKARAMYGKNDLCSILCLPYGNLSYCMYVVLPNEGISVNDIVNALSAQTLTNYLNSLNAHEVDILLPRYTTSSDIQLVEVMSAMGMPRAFSPKAEFPKMAQGLNLYVSMMKQKAMIEVNEEGTRAAAVTIAGTEVTSAGHMEFGKVDFHATRPFLYFIREERTRSLLFMGTYCGD